MAMPSFKHFKKMSSDEHGTVLKHKDGHELTISHKPLSKEMKAQLDKLPIAFSGEKKTDETRQNLNQGSASIKKENYTTSRQELEEDERIKEARVNQLLKENYEHQKKREAEYGYAKGGGVRSPRPGHTIKQLSHLEKEGWRNADTGLEISEDEGKEHLNQLRQNKADKKLPGMIRDSHRDRHSTLDDDDISLAQGGEVPYSKKGAEEISRGASKGEDLMKSWENIRNHLMGTPAPTPSEEPQNYAKGTADIAPEEESIPINIGEKTVQAPKVLAEYINSLEQNATPKQDPGQAPYGTNQFGTDQPIPITPPQGFEQPQAPMTPQAEPKMPTMTQPLAASCTRI